MLDAGVMETAICGAMDPAAVRRRRFRNRNKKNKSRKKGKRSLTSDEPLEEWNSDAQLQINPAKVHTK